MRTCTYNKTITILNALLIATLIPLSSSAQWVVVNSTITGAVRGMAVSGSNLFAGADPWGVALTTNSGTNWNPVNSGLPANAAVACLYSFGTNLFAGISTQGVYVSTNNGASWAASNTGLTNNFVRGFATIGTNLFIATYGGVFLSTNGGASWAAVNNGLTNPTVMSLAASGTTLLAGTDGGGVFVSTNNGANWGASNTGFPSPATTTVWCFLVNGPNIYAGYGRGVVLSTNNGASWATTNTGFPNASINIMYLAATGSDMFAAASGTGVYRSTNSGGSWTTFNTGLFNPTVMSLAIVGTNIFAGTFGSGVWRQQLPTSVREIRGATPQPFSLEQNYPNPFNPTTTIKFSVPNSDHVLLNVFDLMGREVAKLVDENLQAGTFETSFDAAGLASGTYFYRLHAGNVMQTKKFVLMK